MKFIGKNLIIAREAKGLTRKETAERLGCSLSTLGRYERGDSEISVDQVRVLSIFLDKPVEYFYRERDFGYELHSRSLFRKNSSTSETNLNKIKRRNDFFLDYVCYLMSFLEVKESNVIDIGDANYTDFKEEDIEDFANKVREYWGVEGRPIKNISYLLENNGITIGATKEKDVDGLSSFFSFDGKEMYAIFTANGEDRTNYYRSRFTICHELGHIILHKDVVPSEVDNEAVKKIEGQAHRFASSFLMPYKEFYKDCFGVINMEKVKRMKLKWGASMQAILRRMKDLKIIDEKRYQYFTIELARNGYRKSEPYDRDSEIEEPYRIKDWTRKLIDTGLLSGEKILYDTSLSENDLRDIVQDDNLIKVQKRETELRIFKNGTMRSL